MVKILLGVLLCLFIGTAAGGESYSVRDAKGNSATIENRDCVSFGFKTWKEGFIVFEGKTKKACWYWDQGEGVVYVLTTDGLLLQVPTQMFKKDQST